MHLIKHVLKGPRVWKISWFCGPRQNVKQWVEHGMGCSIWQGIWMLPRDHKLEIALLLSFMQYANLTHISTKLIHNWQCKGPAYFCYFLLLVAKPLLKTDLSSSCVTLTVPNTDIHNELLCVHSTGKMWNGRSKISLRLFLNMAQREISKFCPNYQQILKW